MLFLLLAVVSAKGFEIEQGIHPNRAQDQNYALCQRFANPLSCSQNQQIKSQCGCSCDPTCRKLQQCCKSLGMNSKCMPDCAYHQRDFSRFFCAIRDCGHYVNEFSFCTNAGRRRPVERCCEEQNVPEECMGYCRGDYVRDINDLQNDESQLECLSNYNKIQECKKWAIENFPPDSDWKPVKPGRQRLDDSAVERAEDLCKAIKTGHL